MTSAPIAITDDILANTSTSGFQRYGTIAQLSDGGFVITWQSWFQDGDRWGIFGQKFNQFGQKVGSEFQVNTYTTDSQFGARVDSTPTGFVVTWVSVGQDGDGNGVFAQRYDNNAAPIGNEFQVNSFITGSQFGATLLTLPDGRYLLAWSSVGQDGDNSGVFAQIYDQDGTVETSEFQVNSYTTSTQYYPELELLTDGFMVVWNSFGQDGSSYGVLGRKFDFQGNALTNEFQINSYTSSTQTRAKLVTLSDDSFVVVWTSFGQDSDGYGIFARHYDSSGSPLSSEFQVNTTTQGNQINPDITALEDGGYLVSWSSDGQDGDSYGIFGQRFDAGGVQVGNEFQLNVGTTGAQIAGGEISQNPSGKSLVTLADGTIASVWAGLNDEEVYFRLFRAPEAPIDVSLLTPSPTGSDVIASEFQGATKTYSAIAKLADGSFVISWTSDDQDGDGSGIFARQFARDGSPLGAEFVVNTLTSGDQIESDVTALQDGGYLITWASVVIDGDDFGVSAQRYAADGTPIGAEFQVNTAISGPQRFATALATDDGGFVIAWSSFLQDNSSYGVYGQRYNSTGAAVGSEFIINSTTANQQAFPTLASLPGGRFVAAWASDGQDSNSNGIFARIFDGSGSALSGEFQINTTDSGSELFPGIVDLIDGTFVVVWQGNAINGGDNFDIYAQRFSQSGEKIGSELLVNTHTVGRQYYPSIAKLDDGGFIVSWTSDDQDGYRGGVYAQRFDFSGSPVGSEFRLNDLNQGDEAANNFYGSEAIAGLGDGLGVATWINSESGDVYFRLFDLVLDGTPRAETLDLPVNQETDGTQLFSNIASLTNGGFLVTWSSQSPSQDGDNYGVYAQRFDATGAKDGSEFRVNSETTSAQFKSNAAGLSDGKSVIVWSSFDQDGSNYGVFGQLYDEFGAPDGSEFRVNSYTSSTQWNPSVAADANEFIVTWASLAQDGDNYGIFAQRYDLSGQEIGPEFQVNTISSSSQNTPSAAYLANGGFVIAYEAFDTTLGNLEIRAQVFDDAGIAVGSEFTVNSYFLSDQAHASIAALTDGTFIVSWMSFGVDGNNYGVSARLFDSQGQALGGEFQVTSETFSAQIYPSATAVPDGGFVISWSSFDQDGDQYGIFGQRFEASGSPIGSEFRLNATTAGQQIGNLTDGYGVTTLTTLADGRIAATWGGTGSEEIFARTFALDDIATSRSVVFSNLDDATFLETDIQLGFELLDSNVWVFAAQPDTFGGIELVVSGLDPEDIVSVQDGSGVGVVGQDVFFNSQLVGQIDTTDDGAGRDLKIQFDASTSALAVEAIIEQLGFSNLSDDPTNLRILTLNLSGTNGLLASRSISVSVTSVNDAPVLTGDLMSALNEGGSVQISAADLGFTDPDDDGDGVTFTVSSLSNGVVQVNGATQTTFTGTQLAAGQVAFVHDGSSTNTASFEVNVEDGDEDISTPSVSMFNLTVTTPNAPPSRVDITPILTLLNENTNTSAGIKVADIAVTDDGLGTNTLGLTGTDAASFEIRNAVELFFIGATPDFERQASYDVTVTVDDTSVGALPDATDDFTLLINNLSPERLSGTSAADRIIGGADRDIIQGFGGNDFLRGGLQNDFLLGYNGNDRLLGDNGIDKILGGAQNDFIRGGNDRDTLLGENGNDRIYGDAGTDFITGGLGRDFLIGGADRDRFIYNDFRDSRGALRDKIFAFEQGLDDIDLRKIDANTTIAGNQRFKFIGDDAFTRTAGELHYRQFGNAVRLEADLNGNGRADFLIDITGTTFLSAGDIFL